jgi:hypothetical protein
MKLQEYLLFIEQLAGRKAIINQSIFSLKIGINSVILFHPAFQSDCSINVAVYHIQENNPCLGLH